MTGNDQDPQWNQTTSFFLISFAFQYTSKCNRIDNYYLRQHPPAEVRFVRKISPSVRAEISEDRASRVSRRGDNERKTRGRGSRSSAIRRKAVNVRLLSFLSTTSARTLHQAFGNHSKREEHTSLRPVLREIISGKCCFGAKPQVNACRPSSPSAMHTSGTQGTRRKGGKRSFLTRVFRCTPRCVRWSSRCCAADCWRAARRTRCCGRGPACGAPGAGRASGRSRGSSSPGSCGMPRGTRGWSRRRWAGWARCWSSPPRTPPPPPRRRSRRSRITPWWCTCEKERRRYFSHYMWDMNEVAGSCWNSILDNRIALVDLNSCELRLIRDFFFNFFSSSCIYHLSSSGISLRTREKWRYFYWERLWRHCRSKSQERLIRAESDSNFGWASVSVNWSEIVLKFLWRCGIHDGCAFQFWVKIFARRFRRKEIHFVRMENHSSSREWLDDRFISRVESRAKKFQE